MSGRVTVESSRPDGAMRVEINLSIDLKEFEIWEPEKTRAFFAGLAQVIAAQQVARELSQG